MADDLSGLTWIERAQQDPSLRAFVDAELARAGLAVDTLHHQHRIDRQRIAVMVAENDQFRAIITKLRRRLRGQIAPLEAAGDDAA
jgi:hypothetical protein